MGMRRDLGPLAIAVALTGATLSPAADDGAAAELARLQAWLDGTRTLEAPFEQELVSGALGAGLVERGRMLVERPGRMRWDYLEPERKVALIDGDRTGLWIEEDRQYVIGTLGEDGGGLLPALLAGSTPLDELFRATVVEPATPEGRPLLRLEPRDQGAGIGSVTLLLRQADAAVEAAEVHDSAGNTMIYRFGRLRRNREIDAGAFEFEPPPGTEIVGR